MLYLVLIIALIILAVHYLKWKIATAATVYYYVKMNQCEPPSDEDMKECTGAVVENYFKDLIEGIP